MSTIHKVFYEINQCNNTKIASSPVKRFWSKKLLTWGGKKKQCFFSLCFVLFLFFYFFSLFVCFIFYNKKLDAFQLRISVLMTVVGLKCIIIYCKCNSLSFILNALSSIQYSCRMNILLLRMVQPLYLGNMIHDGSPTSFKIYFFLSVYSYE